MIEKAPAALPGLFSSLDLDRSRHDAVSTLADSAHLNHNGWLRHERCLAGAHTIPCNHASSLDGCHRALFSSCSRGAFMRITRVAGLLVAGMVGISSSVHGQVVSYFTTGQFTSTT